MTPLDLSKAAPRDPHAESAGVIFLPRSIDKVRASLPGGNLGLYAIAGFTVMMLEMFEIAPADFTASVEHAASDADVEAFVTAHTTPKVRERWNAFVSAREPRGGNRAEALVAYPWLSQRPDLIKALDVLAEDDVQIFR